MLNPRDACASLLRRLEVRELNPWRVVRGSGASMRTPAVGIVGVLFALIPALLVVTAPAFALNPERHYEQVSPVYKGGFGVGGIRAVSLDGESVWFMSPGSFEGAPQGPPESAYIAHRGVDGWSTYPIDAPPSLVGTNLSIDVDPSLDKVFVGGPPGDNLRTTIDSPEQNLLLHTALTVDRPENWESIGKFRTLNNLPLDESEEASDPAFCNIAYPIKAALEPLVPEDELATGFQLHEYRRGCAGEAPSIKLAGLNNHKPVASLIGRGLCDTSLGDENYSRTTNQFNAVSGDGSEVFFTTCTAPLEASGEDDPHHQLFVRLDGQRTVEVSRPLEACVGNGVPGEVPCNGAAQRPEANFAGASEDGSHVYFMSAAPLTSTDKDTSNDLYEATIGCPNNSSSCASAEREVTALTQVSDVPTAREPANVLGVVRISPDGSRAYFVAEGDLLNETEQEGLEKQGMPVPKAGAANLYAYTSSGAGNVAFIGSLCSGPGHSGSQEDASCPATSASDASLWEKKGESPDVQTTGADGRFLVFATYAKLLPSDTNSVQDVYRYDAENDELLRVSGGEAGYDDNGNMPVFGAQGEPLGATIEAAQNKGRVAEQHLLGNRSITEDGSRIVFASAEPLSPQATSGLQHIYEWKEGAGEGSVLLLSSGPATQSVTHYVISPSGADVFFITSQDLVPGDTDGQNDLYDARLGSGFPTASAPEAPCAGDACQGPLTSPGPLLVPGSISQASGENVTQAVTVTPKKAALKCARGKKRSHNKCVKRKNQRKAKKAKRSSNKRRTVR
ncbi:MAG TPA: hypothetical protein VGL57_06800 [Solirubrobacteraceae bacterium]